MPGCKRATERVAKGGFIAGVKRLKSGGFLGERGLEMDRRSDMVRGVMQRALFLQSVDAFYFFF